MNNPNSHHDGFTDKEIEILNEESHAPGEVIFDAEEVTTLVRIPAPILTETRRPVITVRQANLPSMRSRKAPVGGALSRYLKPDGVHYNRKLLAALGALVLMFGVGILVLRALSRRMGSSEATQAVTVEEAISKGKRGRRSAEASTRLSAGGPPARSSKSKGESVVGSTDYEPRRRSPLEQQAYEQSINQPTDYQVPGSLPRAKRRAYATSILNGTATPQSASVPKESGASSSFAAAWARGMAERLPTLPTQTSEAESSPVATSAPPASAPVAAPARNTTFLLTLLEPATSGIAAPVRARVAGDVKDARGAIIIPHGSIATIPFLAVEVHGRIPQDRQAPITVTLPSGGEMTFQGLVRGRDGLPGLTGKINKAKGGPGWFKKALGIGGRAASVGLSATGIGSVVNPSDVSGMAGVDTFGRLGSSQDREVHAPAGSSITITVGL